LNNKNPRPADVGLLGVLPGITGTIMANEVLKIITQTGNVLSGKMLLFNISDNSFHMIRIRNIPENHNIKELNSPS
jgi:adenylyltransferase/sulfurtransferase